MNKMFFKIGLGLLAVAGLAWPSRGDVAGLKTLHGHVPAITSKLTSVGRVNATNELHLAIGLAVPNPEAMSNMVEQVADPASPNYRHYLTTAEFTEKFGPTESDVEAVTKFAAANGLRVKRVHANRLLMEVDGQAADVEKAFNVTLRSYHLASENRDFYAPDQEPTVASSLPILDVQGLNSFVRPKPNLIRHAFNKSPVNLGSGPSGTYLGNDFRPAYVPGATQTGTGQKVALFEYDGYLASDIAAYEQLSGLPSETLTNILLQGFSGVPYDPDAQGEVTLDIDMVIAMAPGISAVEVYEGNIVVAYLPNLVLNQIAVDNSAHQISSSWGWGGGPSSTTDQIFQQMILQGQTYFTASGDSCAFLPSPEPGSVDDPDYPHAPADDPYLTSVGATTLQTTGPGGAFVSESVWNWGPQGDDGVGSSGGISGYYTIPIWQQGVSMSANQGSTTMRNLPDVALTGDNICTVVNGAEQDQGGTSCAAPLWAGFIALVNEQATAEGNKVVGFINPAIYLLGKSSLYTNYFRDVVLGNNTWSGSPNEFYAEPGYDLCAGWGSPNGTSMIDILAAGISTNTTTVFTPVVPPPVQPWGTTLSVMNGADPNGFWYLFYQDDTLNGMWGTNYNGWSLNLTTANPIGFPADNQLFVSNTNVSVLPGGTWTTTLAVTNFGPATSTNVFISDQLPDSSGVSLVASSSSILGATIEVVGSTLNWTIGSLPVNTGGTLSLKFTGNVAGSYTNAATVYSASDPNPDDDSVGVAIVVAPPTPPSISPRFSATGNKAFTLSVTNVAGSTVVIQASTNLTTWVPVVTNEAPFTFTNFDDTNFLYRFYRAVITGQ